MIHKNRKKEDSPSSSPALSLVGYSKARNDSNSSSAAATTTSTLTSAADAGQEEENEDDDDDDDERLGSVAGQTIMEEIEV